MGLNTGVIPGYNSRTITTQTTTLVKSGQGVLHALDFTAVANGTITIYDALTATGTPIRTITSPGTVTQNEVNKILDITFSTGLTIVTGVANQDIVVSFI
jgi:hypothetical protein